MISREKLKVFLDSQSTNHPVVIKPTAMNNGEMIIWKDFEQNYACYSFLEKEGSLLPDILKLICE